MNLVHKIEKWGDVHHPGALDIIRIALGIFLLLKGYYFMENSTYLEELTVDQHIVNISPGLLAAIVYYVTFAHLAGGSLVTIGTLTRFACLLQIPIVLGAIFVTGVFQEPINALIWPSVVALLLLSLFAVIGSGPISFDRFLANWRES
jgi:putative oxidoreductase